MRRLEVLTFILVALAAFGLGQATQPKEQAVVPPVVACAPRQDQDRACVAWLFETDLGKARDRICGGRR